MKIKKALLVMTEKLFLVKYFFNPVKTFAHTFPPHIPQSELILQIKLLQSFDLFLLPS